MAYLDDSSRVNGQIVLMTIPALAFFAVRGIQSLGGDSSATLDELARYINYLIFISPIFVIVQVTKMVSGTAARSWQNLLCTVLTAAAAAIYWANSGVQLNVL
jgi:hypothetical protein